MKFLPKKKWCLGFSIIEGDFDISISPLFALFAKENLTEVAPDLAKIKELLAAKKFSEVKKQFPTVIIPQEVFQHYRKEAKVPA